MTNEEVNALFHPLFDEIHNLVGTELDNRPLLAHYTSMDVLEKIVKNEEIWFSNPLFMNDTQELSYGLSEGLKEFDSLKDNGALLNACGAPQRLHILLEAFYHYVNKFEEKALDIFVFCLSQFDDSHEHGRLSMWRGYGENGNGAAIVFNTHVIESNSNSPLVFAKVQYRYDDDRRNSIKQRMRPLNHAIDFLKKAVAVYAIFGSTSCQGSNASKSSTVLARGN